MLDVLSSGGGRPLDADTRADMEGRLGHDFGDVRVHTDSAAADSAAAVGAHAYTVGRDVVFQRDAYDPSRQAGRTTLAHELTHVVQQRCGPVDGTPDRGRRAGVRPGRPLRDGGGRQRRAGDGGSRPHATAGGAPVVQREEAPEDEEEVQGSFVQREEAEEEEPESA